MTNCVQARRLYTSYGGISPEKKKHGYREENDVRLYNWSVYQYSAQLTYNNYYPLKRHFVWQFELLDQINNEKGIKTYQNSLWMNITFDTLWVSLRWLYLQQLRLQSKRKNLEHSILSSFEYTQAASTTFRCPLQLCFTVIVLKQMMNQIGDTKSIHSLPYSLFF